jgi:hypothetical protein
MATSARGERAERGGLNRKRLTSVTRKVRHHSPLTTHLPHMSWFTEDSTPVLVLGIITEAMLLLALVKTSRLGLLYAIAGVGIVVGAIVVIEKNTVTDTKLIRGVLDSAAAAVERNDVAAVLDLISPGSQTMRQEVAAQVPQFEIRSAYIRGLEIKINRFNNPLSATAEFFGHIEGRQRRGMLPQDHYVARIKVTLIRDKDRWLMDKYEWQPGIGIGASGE